MKEFFSEWSRHHHWKCTLQPVGVGEDIIALIYTYKSDTSENNHPPIWFNLTIVIQPSETIRQSHLTPKNLKLFDNLIWHQKIWNHLIIITNTIWNHPIIIINTIWTHLIISGVWWFSLSQQYISHPTTLEQGNFEFLFGTIGNHID